MKKAFALALALALLLSLSIPALAFTVVASSQALSVNGQIIDCEKYNIDNNNYFKLRDIAYLLNGTGSQFDIGWDAEKGVASITTGQPYTFPNGTELVVGADQSATAKVSTQTIMIDGVVRDDLTVYNIGDNNFFQLREMGDALGFDVGYDDATRTMLVTSKGSADPSVSASIKLDTVSFSLNIGETKQITANVTPAGAAVEWSTGDPAIATVDSSGLVTAVNMGKVDIFASSGGQKTFCTLTVNPPEEVTIFSRENLVYRIPYDKLEQHLKWGFTTEPQELKIDAAGGDWLLSGPALLLRNTEGHQIFSGDLEKMTTNISTIWFVRGSTWVSINESSIIENVNDLKYGITRMEIADTVTSISEYDFRFSKSITRVGIPPSVTSIGYYGYNLFSEETTIYGVPGSKAEEYAKSHGNPFIAASPLYAPDGRVVMVTEEERALYKGNGWYAVPVTRVYAPDGRTKVITESELASNVAVGWESLDGKIANDLIPTQGYNAAVQYLESALKAVPTETASVLNMELQQILNAWQQSIGCPVAIVAVSVGAEYGYPEVGIRFRNLTQTRVTRLDIKWTCLDAYGNPTSDSYWISSVFAGYTNPGETFAPGQARWIYWKLYSNEETTQISNYYMTGVAFEDGTSWHR